MAETTIQKETQYDGTKSSMLQMILGRTFGNTLVQAALVLICFLWSLPTIGLLVSSVRTPNDINSSGWWTLLQGSGTLAQSIDVEAEMPEEGPINLGRSRVAPGSTIVVLAGQETFEEQLAQSDISAFQVNSVAGRASLEGYDMPLTLPDIGTMNVTIGGIASSFRTAEGFNGDVVVTSEPTQTLPQTLSYDILDAGGNVVGSGEIEINEFDTSFFINDPGDLVEGEGEFVGSLRVEIENLDFNFEPASNFTGELQVADTLGVSFPVNIDFVIVDDGPLLTSDAGGTLDVLGFGDVRINADGSYSISPTGEFVTVVNTEYTAGDSTYALGIFGNSRLLAEAPSGFPDATVANFGVTSVLSDITIPAFDEPVEIPGVATITVGEDGEVSIEQVQGFNGVIEVLGDVEEEAPFTMRYLIEGLEIVEDEYVVDLLEDDVDIDAYGEPVEIDDIGIVTVQENGEYTFEAAEAYADFADMFELVIPEEATEPPFEAIYRYAPYGERLNLTVAFAFISPDGTIELETRGATSSIELTNEVDNVMDLPFTLEYEAVRRSGRVVTSDSGETQIISGFGELKVQENGSYEITASEDFNGQISYRYDIQNPFVTLDNYEFVLTEDGMDQAFINSLTVSIPATIIPIAIAAFAAYAFSWMEFPGRRVLFVIVVGLMVVPLQVAFIPLLNIYTDLDLNGTFLGLWLAHTGFGMPLAVFLLRNYISGLPRELIESASIDGASHFTIFLRLVLPLSVPALASFAIFQFLWVWNDLLVALVFLGDKPVVTSRLSEMVGSRGQDWFVLTSGAFITMIVPLVVFFSLQRYFVRGLLAGSVKGG
jgi:alpha-glucoside transport system permease protein